MRALRLAALWAAALLTASGGAGAAAAHGTLAVTSPLPSWLAPGGRLAVEGTASPGEEVRLLVGGRQVGKGRARWNGRFRLAALAPRRPGLHRLVVTDGAARVSPGLLTVRPLVLAAIGDVTFAGPVADAIAERGPRYPWLRVAAMLRGADIATANLEGAVSVRGEPVPGKLPHLRGAPAALRAAVRFAGLDVLSVANNHTLDFGRGAFFDTLRLVRRFGARPAGGGSFEAAHRAALVERGGLRVAFLGYDDIFPGFHARPGAPGTAGADPAVVAEDVERAAARADLVVVWFHWGEQYEPEPNDRQRELAAAAHEAGAAVVLGAHPHVLQPVQASRFRLTAWSLGNFVFYHLGPAVTRTGILLVSLGRGGVAGYELLPARIVRFQPRLLRAGAVGPGT